MLQAVKTIKILCKRVMIDTHMPGVSHQTIYKLMESGLPSHKIGKKRVFLKEDLVKWIKNH